MSFMLLPLLIGNIRERSFLILGTRAEDNFTQLEKISYPILNIAKDSRTQSSFSKMVQYPHLEVLVHKA